MMDMPEAYHKVPFLGTRQKLLYTVSGARRSRLLDPPVLPEPRQVG